MSKDMSKEKKAFAAWWQKNVGKTRNLDDIFDAVAIHYQPNPTSEKCDGNKTCCASCCTLLEQARDGLIVFAEKPTTTMDSYPCHKGITTKEKCGRCGNAIRAWKVYEAINAATGSTRIEDSVRSIKSCETSLMGEK